MIFRKKQHLIDLYSILLSLSRNKFFYQNINLPDTFQTRIYLMFMHFSVMLIIYRKKGKKFDQKSYDHLFHNIENNLREMGLGDVSVNKKMKDLNKILYDILLKIKINKDKNTLELNPSLINKYFVSLKDGKIDKFNKFEDYLKKFYNFCFELPLENVLLKVNKFK